MKPMETHSLLLNTAAKSILEPAGLVQKGRSRTWLGDNGWWLEVVEFQPSGVSKGSYLNVGCMWLWNVADHPSFDEGYRAAGFQKYENDSDFTTAAEMLSRTALQRVLDYRARFVSIYAVSDHYLKCPPAKSFWTKFNAAVAHTLCGRTEPALLLLERITDCLDQSVEWQRIATRDVREIERIVHEVQQVREIMSARVLCTRRALKLSPMDTVDFSRIPASLL